jgi:hypothetical protein
LKNNNLTILQPFVHYFLHLGFPLWLAVVCYRKDWRRAYAILLATMLVDLDHLLADPVFQADRCSIGFHYLHTGYACIVYVAMLFGPRWLRLAGIGLLLHMLTDYIDCLFMLMAK